MNWLWSRSPETIEKVGRVVISRPGQRIHVRVRRKGVEPTSGCVVFIPIWLVTRLRWQFSDHLWTAELAFARDSSLAHPEQVHDFPTREQALALAGEWIAQASEGDFDS